MANLSSLTSLTLYDCNLQGEFPPNIFLLPRIQSIDLSYNPKLVGFLPKFQSRSSLKKLRLPNTNFSGELPGSISNLKSLNYLDLFYTKISGELPNSINNLKFLNYLDLSSSNFSRTIPHLLETYHSLLIFPSHITISMVNFHLY